MLRPDPTDPIPYAVTIVTTAICAALVLAGCGGGECGSSGALTPPGGRIGVTHAGARGTGVDRASPVEAAGSGACSTS